MPGKLSVNFFELNVSVHPQLFIFSKEKRKVNEHEKGKNWSDRLRKYF